MDFKYKIKGAELYIFVDFKTELSREFLSNAKEKIRNLNNEISIFAKRIGFDGKIVKVIVQGVLIATIALKVDVKGNELLEDKLEEVKFEDKLQELELDINKYYLSEDSKKYGNPMKPKYIVIHNTANSASSYNEISYLHDSENDTYISFHYAVDDEEVWQALPDNVNGWHAGDGSTLDSYNRNSIGVEIAKSTDHNDDLKDSAIDKAARLVAYLTEKHGIPIDNVITHHDASGKYCPHDIFDRYGWDNFIKLVNEYKS